MIAAKKHALWDRAWQFWLTWTLKKRFAAIHVRGLANLQSLASNRPTIAFSNHTNWWDAAVLLSLARTVSHKNFYCVMEEAQLKRQRYLTYLGAFSVDLENPLRAAAAIRYAVRLLQNTASLVWVFPQGGIASSYEKVTVKAGIQFLAAQAAGAQMLPTALHYDFFKSSKPEVLIEIGEPFAARDSDNARLSNEIQRLRDKLERAVQLEELKGFHSPF